MPVEISVDGISKQITASTYWKVLSTNEMAKTIEVDRDYYVAAMKVF